MRLIIAEKHSVGQAIAQAVGGHMEKHDGYVPVSYTHLRAHET